MLSVTTNLGNLLRQLRQSGRTTSKDLLWIDALCINQKDLDEKAQQIPLMGEIYANAARVWIWLGEATERTAGAFAGITFLAEMADQILKESGISWETRRAEQFGRDRANRLDPNKLKKGGGFWTTPGMTDSDTLPPEWPDAIDMFTNDYFKRLWTMQEMVLAREDRLEVICGPHGVSWDEFAKTASLVALSQLLLPKDVLIVDIMSITTVDALRQFHRTSPERISLCGLLLDETCGTSVTFPCDRIFGMLCMLPNTAVKDSIPVDYKEPVQKVFQNAAASIVTYEQKLDFLGALDYRPEDRAGSGSWPSWVPDFTDRWQLLHSLKAMKGMEGVYNILLNSDGHESLRPSVEGDTLILKGFVLDEVSAVTENFPHRPPDSTASTNPAWCQDIVKLIQAVFTGYDFPSEQEQKSLCWTFIQIDDSIFDILCDTEEEYNRRFGKAYAPLISGIRELLRHWEFLHKLSTGPEALAIHHVPSFSEDCTKTLDRIHEIMVTGPRSRNFFRLDEGGFGIGPNALTLGTEIHLPPGQAQISESADTRTSEPPLPPPVVQPGDIIAVICGYDRPLVLRRNVELDSISDPATVIDPKNTRKTYTLIGNAYVGEIKDLVHERGLRNREHESHWGTLKEFRIR